MAKSKILVTGGAGFIGSVFANKISENNIFELHILDIFTYAGNINNLSAIKNKYKLHKVDLRDRDKVYNLILTEKYDYIVNFAAESHVDNSINRPLDFIDTNVYGTINLLEAAKETSITKFVQVSTDEVYGSLAIGLANENHEINPSSPYSASKSSADSFVISYAQTFNLPTNIVRCSNNYGSNQHEEKLIPLTVNRIAKKLPIPVYGNGKNIREWIHVNDSTEAIMKVLLSEKVNEIYNISSGVFLENLNLVKTICDLLDVGYELIKFVEDRKGHDFRYAINSAKIRDALGWSPKVSFEVGIKSTVEELYRKFNGE